MIHTFDTDDACRYGQEEAVIIQNFRFWIGHNKANRMHQHDGRTWTYNSIQAFTELFPYWTRKQISRIVNSLIDAGILVTGNYNKDGRDRTIWYAFKDENEILNGKMHFTKRENAFHQTVTPLPDSKHTDIEDIVEFEQLDGKASNKVLISTYQIEAINDQRQNTEDSGSIELQVLTYLNIKAGTEYRPTAKAHKQIIQAREKEGYTLADFQKVIDTKVADWLQDAKMRKFLRPSTLFNASHFPEYLNERRIDQAVTQAHEAHDVQTPHDESYNKYLRWCKNTYPAIIDHVKHLSKAQFIEFRERKFHKEAKNFQEAFNFKRLDKSHREMAEVAAEREKYKDIWTKFLADYDSYMKKITIQ